MRTAATLVVLVVAVIGVLLSPVASLAADGQWVKYTGQLPNNALPGGQERQMDKPRQEQVLYICRVSFKNGLHPGKLRHDQKQCNIGWRGKEHAMNVRDGIEVFVADKGKLEWRENSTPIQSVVLGGWVNEGAGKENLYLCRKVDAQYPYGELGTYPGKWYKDRCWYAYNGRELESSEENELLFMK